MKEKLKMNKSLWTIIFILVVAQASAFGYALNMNNRFALLQEQVIQSSPELDSIVQNQALLNTDIHHIIKVIKGLIIQVQYLTNEIEKNKVQKIEKTSGDELRIG